MSGLLKKRSREDVEAPMDSQKRFHGEREQQILYLLEDGDGKEDCSASEELVSGVMKSLEEEIGVTCSTSYVQGSGLSRDKSVPSDATGGLRDTQGLDSGSIDLDYLLGASDDELGIPPSPVLNLEDQDVSSAKEQFSEAVPSVDYFAVNPELNGFCDNWQFEDDFADYRQFSAFEDAADLVNHGTLLDGDYSAAWRLETAGGMY